MGSRLFNKSFPMTQDQGSCPHLTQGPGGSGLMVVYPLCPLQALGAVTRRLDPSQALGGKFQTSPVIPQIICCELSVQSHLARGIGRGGRMCRLQPEVMEWARHLLSTALYSLPRDIWFLRASNDQTLTSHSGPRAGSLPSSVQPASVLSLHHSSSFHPESSTLAGPSV